MEDTAIDWTRLVDDTAPRVRRWLRNRYRSTDDEAHDATATALLNLWRSRDLIDVPRIAQLFHTAAYNALIDMWRRQQTRQAMSSEPLTDELEAVRGGDRLNIERDVTDRDSMIRILDALPDGDAALLICRHIYGYTQEEMAHANAVPLSTIRMRLVRARKRFKAQWNAAA